MANITVSVPDEVYRAARIRAAEEGTSVSALVAEHLRSLAGKESEFERLEARQRRILEDIGSFRASERIGRDEVHGRAVR